MRNGFRLTAILVTFECIVFGCIVFGGMMGSATAAGPAKISASSVWQMPESFTASARGTCDKSAPSAFAECFMNQMTPAGASADSVRFTRALYKQSQGDVGIMTGFQPVGPVDIAWITYPLRANTNYGLLLVNGKPPTVNVEDLKLLDRKTMEASPQFKDLKFQFPKVEVWPGDRDGKTWPNSQTGSDGGIQFTVGYPLINGCHACARAGSAMFTWNFSVQGKFLGTTFVGMTPPPL
jgi:hypothetical protein